jgi:hypothetical protein
MRSLRLARFWGGEMPTLKIDLQEGFSGEPVVVLLNGKEVYRGTPKTRTQIGLADSKSFDLPSQQLKLEVATPLSGVSESLDVDLFQDTYVGVTLSSDGAIALRLSLEPFGYV